MLGNLLGRFRSPSINENGTGYRILKRQPIVVKHVQIITVSLLTTYTGIEAHEGGSLGLSIDLKPRTGIDNILNCIGTLSIAPLMCSYFEIFLNFQQLQDMSGATRPAVYEKTEK